MPVLPSYPPLVRHPVHKSPVDHLNPSIPADSFTFTPPADAKPIQFQAVASATETTP